MHTAQDRALAASAFPQPSLGLCRRGVRLVWCSWPCSSIPEQKLLARTSRNDAPAAHGGPLGLGKTKGPPRSGNAVRLIALRRVPVATFRRRGRFETFWRL